MRFNRAQVEEIAKKRTDKFWADARSHGIWCFFGGVMVGFFIGSIAVICVAGGAVQ